ncbi:MAG TPA: DUF4097 family beta strand repeat-containing protein [Micromonosporaceae bacterium]
MGSWTVSKPDRLRFDEPVTALDVRLMAGRLNVVGTDGPPRVEVTRIGTRPVHVTLTDGLLRVEHDAVREPWQRFGPFGWFLGGHRRYTADVSIAVPPRTVAALSLVSGALVASTLSGGARVDCTSGRVTLLGLGGESYAKVVSGPIEALGCGGDLSVETVSGEITIADSNADRVSARTISGALTCDLDNPSGSDIRLQTVSGQITVRVREDSDLQVHLHATSGRVTSAFEGLNASWPPGVKDVRGTLGAGTGRLWANATSGRIALLRRPVDDEFDRDRFDDGLDGFDATAGEDTTGQPR